MRSPVAGQRIGGRTLSGRRSKNKRPRISPHIDWLSTLLAKGTGRLKPEHLRYRRTSTGGAVLHCILLDCSASMLRGQRLSLAKGLVQAWVEHCYQRRESLTLIGFSGQGAYVLKTPSKAAPFNHAWISAITGGGATPIHAALNTAERLLAKKGSKFKEPIALWLLSDVRFGQLPERPRFATQATVIDFDQGPRALGRAQKLAQLWQAECVEVQALINE